MAMMAVSSRLLAIFGELCRGGVPRLTIAGASKPVPGVHRSCRSWVRGCIAVRMDLRRDGISTCGSSFALPGQARNRGVPSWAPLFGCEALYFAFITSHSGHGWQPFGHAQRLMALLPQA